MGERISRLVGAVQSEVLEARLTPVREVFDRFPRVVRDLARDLGRQVALEVEGGDIELDRAVLDEMADPLVHLVRNAVDHGIEAPRDRVKAGKPAEGRIRLSAIAGAEQRGDPGGRRRPGHRPREDPGQGEGRRPGRCRRPTSLADDQLLRILARSGLQHGAR